MQYNFDFDLMTVHLGEESHLFSPRFPKGCLAMPLYSCQMLSMFKSVRLTLVPKIVCSGP